MNKLTLTILITTILVAGCSIKPPAQSENTPIENSVISTSGSVMEPDPTIEANTEPNQETTADTAEKDEALEKATSEISFVTCMESLYNEDRGKYDYLKNKFAELYPDLRVYDAGAYCELSSGNQLVSFSHFTASGKIEDASQTIVLFDANNNQLTATIDFYCETIGDLGYPIFQSIDNNIVTMRCSSGDAGASIKQIYELDIDTFEFNFIKEEDTRYN